MSMNIKKTDILINKDEKKYTTLSKNNTTDLRGCLSEIVFQYLKITWVKK